MTDTKSVTTPIAMRSIATIRGNSPSGQPVLNRHAAVN